MTAIGYQDGITAFFNRLRDMDPGGTILKKDSKGKWLPIESLADKPIDSWKAYDKAERCFTILKDDHDAAIANPSPPPSGGGEPPPVQTYLKVAPITVREEGGSDQMVCLFNSDGSLRPGVVRLENGEYTDESGAKYAADGDGRENSGVRSKVTDPALVGARSMDGRSACQCSPVGSPYDNTGSWTV